MDASLVIGEHYRTVSPEETAALTEAAAGRVVLEIGSLFGWSTVNMATTARHVLAVDPHIVNQGLWVNTLQQMRANVDACGVADRVSIVWARSQDILPALIGAGARFGLVFVDGDHENAVGEDIDNSLRLLGLDGILAVHDYNNGPFPRVKEAVDSEVRGTPEPAVGMLWMYPKRELASDGGDGVNDPVRGGHRRMLGQASSRRGRRQDPRVRRPVHRRDL